MMLSQRDTQADVLSEVTAGWNVIRFHAVRPNRRGVVDGPVEAFGPNAVRVPVSWAGSSDPELLAFTPQSYYVAGRSVLVGDSRAVLMFAPGREKLPLYPDC